jgi:carbamoyl-phosphate synthase large subunit
LRNFVDLGFKIYATPGTKRLLDQYNIPSESVAKIGRGRPNVLDLILNKQVDLVLNTPSPRRDAQADGSSIRKAALKYRIPYMTTLAAALMSARGIAAERLSGKGEVESIQEYHASIQY